MEYGTSTPVQDGYACAQVSIGPSVVWYQITVQVTKASARGYMHSYGLPTFYLRNDVQGIISAEHAARIALAMLTDLDASAEYQISAAGNDGSYASLGE